MVWEKDQQINELLEQSNTLRLKLANNDKFKPLFTKFTTMNCHIDDIRILLHSDYESLKARLNSQEQLLTGKDQKISDLLKTLGDGYEENANNRRLKTELEF